MFVKKTGFLVFFAACLTLSNAWGVPTVKKLGVAKSTNVVSKNSNGANVSRAASLRSNVNTSKPVTISKTVSENKDSYTNATTSRLTVGKYLHNKGVNSGVIKPTVSSASSQSDEIINLTDRVVQLENKIDTKQNELFVGDGIIIENDVISVDPSVQNLPDKVDTITEQLDEKVDVENLSTNYYTKSEVQNVVNQEIQNAINEGNIKNNDTVYDVGSGERKYVSIVDSFNKEILN